MHTVQFNSSTSFPIALCIVIATSCNNVLNNVATSWADRRDEGGRGGPVYDDDDANRA